MIIKGVFVPKNLKYSREELEKAVKILNGNMEKNPIIGVLPGGTPPDFLDVSFDNASHTLEEIKVTEDNSLEMVINVLDTPCGIILKELVNMGVSLSLTPIMTGNVDDNRNVSDLIIHRVDVDRDKS